MSLTLGLDLGTNSIGWALVDEENRRIIDANSRIFEAGVDFLNQKKEATKKANQSEVRQIIRMKRRKDERKKDLQNVLVSSNFLDGHTWEDMINLEPYSLRAKAVHERIELHELSRIFYHFAQRRGFKSNRKAPLKSDKEDKEIGVVLSSISELKNHIAESRSLTLGEYLNTLNPHEKRIRNHYTERSMYVEEFDLIWKTQKMFYPYILTDELNSIIRNKILFFQRPLQSQKSRVGKCLYENKKRALKCSFEFQEFRMLQQINSITISGEGRYGQSNIKISIEERGKLLNYLNNHKEVELKDDEKNPHKSYKVFKSILGLKKDGFYTINISSLDRINGEYSKYYLHKALGESFNNIDQNTLSVILDTLCFARDNEWLINHAINKWNFSPEEAKALTQIKLEEKYCSLSKKAIRKLLPLMREGLQYHEAVIEAYGANKAPNAIERTDFLPKPDQIANPVVMKCLKQLRKVVNCIIYQYGKPDIVRIELSRDMKNTLDKRLKIKQLQIRNRIENERIRRFIIDNHLKDNPSRNDIIKYKLYEECNRICPYTGRSIRPQQLFDGNDEVEIEHILPYSKSFDDSFSNKTLCYKIENHNKNNMTPFQFYSQHSPEQYAGIKERVSQFKDKRKVNRFYAESVEAFYKSDGESDFVSRQMNDTRYASRIAFNYLKHICDDVTVSRGGITGLLREYWGLNSILKPSNDELMAYQDCKEGRKKNKNNTYTVKNDGISIGKKNRGDHRHHAVDAIVIALSNRSLVQRLSYCHGLGEYNSRLKFGKHPQEWPSFWTDIKTATQNMIVSIECNYRVRGQLFEKTNFGKIQLPQSAEINKTEPLCTKSA